MEFPEMAKLNFFEKRQYLHFMAHWKFLIDICMKWKKMQFITYSFESRKNGLEKKSELF